MFAYTPVRMHFADALTEKIRASTPICVGLDPALDKLPEGIEKNVEGVWTFSKAIIDAVKDTAAAVKPQMAYFEVLGWEGMKAFWAVCAYAKSNGLIVIADGKRNDIGSTCEAYADAYLFKDSPIDALTITPFMGSDGVLPFIERCTKNDKGIYIQVKNSNPSSGEIQDLPVGDEVVHEHLAQLVESWGAQHIGPDTNLSCVGAVVGATYPEESKYLRTLMPHIPFLVPGYGAQGATAEDVKWNFLPDGTGAIVNAGRSIIFASKKKDFAEAARKAAKEMAEDLASVISDK